MFGFSLGRSSTKTPPAPAALTPYCRTGQDLAACLLEHSHGPNELRYRTGLSLAGACAGFACGVLASRHVNHVAIDILPSNAYGRGPDFKGLPTFRGGLIDGPLLMDRTAFYRVLVTKARTLGVTHLPNIAALAESADPVDFDPLAELDEAPLLPRLARVWPDVQGILGRYDRTTVGWPLSFGAAAGQIMAEARHTVDPTEATQLIMRSALMTARLTPAHLAACLDDGAPGGEAAA